MPALSHKRLHGRAYMVRAMMRAGEFVHLDEYSIGRALDDLYDLKVRTLLLAERRVEIESDLCDLAEKGVPMALLRAKRGRLLVAPAFDAMAVGYVAQSLQVTCCLCLGAGLYRRWGYDVPSQFLTYVCPTHLRCAGLNLLPLCNECQAQISNRAWREFGFRTSGISGVECGALLAWLATNPKFRERVKSYAWRARTLRFDPRRFPTPERLAA